MAKRRAVKKQTSDEKYIATTVTVADRSAPKFKPTEAVQLVKRLQQFVLWCCMFNAQNASQHKLRMYRKVGAAGSKEWDAARKVKGLRRNDYLRNPAKGYGPGVKAATYAEDADDIEEVVKHPMLDLLNNANPFQRGTQFSKANFFQWGAFGDNKIHVVQGKNAEAVGMPTELWVMGAQWVRPVPDVHNLISGWIYGRDRTVEQFYPVDEVVSRIWFPNPFSPYTGLCPLHAVFEEGDLYRAYTDGDLSSQRNGARPDFAVSLPKGSTQEQINQMRAEIQKRHQGPTRRGDFFIFTEAEVTPLGFSPREMENLAGRANSLSLIAACYGIPEGFWKGNDTKRAGSDSMHEQYGRYTMGPMLNQDAEEWTEFLDRYGIDPGEYWLAYDDPCPENRELIRQEIDTYLKNRVYTRNEARAILGLEPVDGGDEFEPSAAEQAQADREFQSDQADKERKQKPKGEEKAVSLPVVKDARQGDKYDPFRLSIEHIIRQWLLDIGNDSSVPDMLDDLQDSYEKLATKLMYPIGGAMRMGAYDGFQMISEAPREVFITDTAPAKFIENYTIRLSKELTGTTVSDIRDVLKNKLEEGSTNQQRTAAVRELMQDQAGYRPATIARTETARAQAHGELEAWKASGIKQVKWVLAADACEVCKAFVEQYGDIRNIDAPFAKVGNLIHVEGKEKPVEITYGTGGSDDGVWAPPLHPNDRCAIQPVLGA